MNVDDRARAAKALLANPLMKALLQELRQDHLDAIAATALPQAEKREYHYIATQVLAEMTGQLEVWAAAVKQK